MESRMDPQPVLPGRRGLILGAAGAVAAGVGSAAIGAARRGGSGRRLVSLATVSANYREGFERIAREYERLHPGTSVRVQVMPSNGYETWLRTQIPGAGAAGPDLFNANFGWGMYEHGLLANLGPYLERTNPYTGLPWIRTLSQQFVEKLKIGGDVSCIPLDFVEVAFYYNQDHFDRLGLVPPTTWEEMIGQGRRLRSAGHIPFAVPGNSESYWSGTVGWICRFFSDAYTRHLVPFVISQPGDWDYDRARNGRFRLNLKDPYNDAYIVVNNERIVMAVRDGHIRVDTPRFAEAYERIREFAGLWQRGYHGATEQTAYHLFLTGRASVLLDTSGLMGQVFKDMADLPSTARFRWGVYPVPRMTTSAFGIEPFRGVGGAGTVLGITKKQDPAQIAASVDFLMFLSSPPCARMLVDEAMRNHRPLVGPMLVPGVRFPERMQELFRPFEGRGFERLSFRGLLDEQQSVWEWTVWAQRYMEGRLSLQEFLRLYQRTVDQAIPRVIALQRLDMNPRTKDIKS